MASSSLLLKSCFCVHYMPVVFIFLNQSPQQKTCYFSRIAVTYHISLANTDTLLNKLESRCVTKSKPAFHPKPTIIHWKKVGFCLKAPDKGLTKVPIDISKQKTSVSLSQSPTLNCPAQGLNWAFLFPRLLFPI